MFTIIETPTFEADARKIWTEEERSAFFAWLAASPEIGDPIPGSGGCKKGSLVGSGFGEAWWGASYLRHQAGKCRDLVVGDLPKGRQGQHTRSYPEVDS